MRWERLFDDLEARLAAEGEAELDAEVADRTRRERARLGLHERLSAARGGAPVVLTVRGVGRLGGQVGDVGPDWLLLSLGHERAAIVALPALLSLTGLAGRIAPLGAVAKGFGLAAAVRAVSRDRAVVTIVDIEGGRHTGTIDAVGADALDLAEHPVDLPRREANVVEVRVLPFAAIAAVLRE